ncbi:MAG: Re/Si-specific NAD(P)(+) transhydrogenase subunit alpha [Leptospiraceae bacterium]|nr:Re/Si-specific NAD(P)(+) transhydrogenase subunit alpha [Leptospiraceae bacterium]MCP5496921.1 Re/Si-specific NAD(P)(+) transhydrogenase subunit alpha [Leptospiraceae bacterium]
MKLGVLKEPEEEKRVSMLPEAVDVIVKMGISVLVETGAGVNSSALDEDYKKVGAELSNKKDVLSKSDILLKIHPPTNDEINSMKAGQVLISILQPMVNPKLIKALADKKVTVCSMDTIPRITRGQSMDVLSSQSTVAGYKAVLLAASHLTRFFPMLTTAAGTIPPTKVVIIGAGVAGLMAIATAKRLGAVIEVSDTRPETKEQVMSLGGKFIEVEGAADASKAGGYAVEQSEDYMKRQKEALHKSIAKSDVVISTALIPGRKAPIIITEQMVKDMKPGSVIVDLAAVMGGNCELTENNKTVVKHDVTIIGNSNLQGTVPFDASKMYGKNVINFLKLFAIPDKATKEVKLVFDFEDEIIAGTVTAHDGAIRHQGTLDALNKG